MIGLVAKIMGTWLCINPFPVEIIVNSCILAFALVASADAQTGVIVYARAPQGTAPGPIQNICTIQVSGSGDQCLTTDGHSHDPSWSPDGKRILFIHDSVMSTPPPYRETEETRSHHPVELSVMDANGENRRVIRTIEPVIHSAAWSPDGETLALTAAIARRPDEPPDVGLFLLSATGNGELRLIRRNAWNPSWSPDGRKLAFTVEYPRGRWGIHTAHVDGTGEAALGNPDVNNGSPVWSPNRREIAFDQFTEQGRRQQVFVMNADGSGMQQITKDSAWSCGGPSWSPGGDYLSVSCRSAELPCGMGIVSTGQKRPECDRRVFLVPVTSETSRSKLFDHDGFTAHFAPR